MEQQSSWGCYREEAPLFEDTITQQKPVAVYTQGRPKMNGLLLHYTLALTKALDQQRVNSVMCGLPTQPGKAVDVKIQKKGFFNTLF